MRTDHLDPRESARVERRDKRRRTAMVVDGAALKHRPAPKPKGKPPAR